MNIKYSSNRCKVIDAPANGPIVAVVSTEDVDMRGDIVLQEKNERGAGWLLDDYNRRNGRIYWMHDYYMPNLAKSTAWVDNKRLMLKISFDMDDELAARLAHKIRGGYLDEWSVGYVPLVSERNEHGGETIYEAELWEVSIVNQGMQPQTETIQKSMLQAVDVVGAMDARLHNIEAQIMRLSKKADSVVDNDVRDALRMINRYRTGV